MSKKGVKKTSMKEDEYDEKDLRTHIYDTTDKYAGSDEATPDKLAILNGDKIEFSDIEYIPVIFKMLDEALVNSRDQRERLRDMKGVKHVTEIRVTIDPKEGIISVFNNGVYPQPKRNIKKINMVIFFVIKLKN